MFFDTFWCIFGEIFVILNYMTNFNNFISEVANTIRTRLVSHQQQRIQSGCSKETAWGWGGGSVVRGIGWASRG